MFGFSTNEDREKNKETFIQSVIKSFGEPETPKKGGVELMEFVREDSRNKELRGFAEYVFYHWKQKGYLDKNNLLIEKKLQEA